MFISLMMFISVLTVNQANTNFDLEGSWSEQKLKTVFFDSIKSGGEDSVSIKLRKPIETKDSRQIQFNKDGTGKFIDTVSSKTQEFAFRYVTGEHNKEHYLFIAFDQPSENQEKPLLVLRAKVRDKDQILLKVAKSNSRLGKCINQTIFQRNQVTISN